MTDQGAVRQTAAMAAIAERTSSYVEQLTSSRDAEAARDYYTDDARLLGPGMDLDRSAVIDGIRAAFEVGIEVLVSRRTLELFVHDDAAYEIAQPPGARQSSRSPRVAVQTRTAGPDPSLE